MKKILAIACLSLFSVTAFAKENVNQEFLKVEVKDVNAALIAKEAAAKMYADFMFTTSCGSTWHVTGGSGMSTLEILDILLAFDDAVCP